MRYALSVSDFEPILISDLEDALDEYDRAIQFYATTYLYGHTAVIALFDNLHGRIMYKSVITN